MYASDRDSGNRLAFYVYQHQTFCYQEHRGTEFEGNYFLLRQAHLPLYGDVD